MVLEILQDDLKDALKILALANGAGDLIEQLQARELRLHPRLRILAFADFSAQGVIGRAQGAFPFFECRRACG